jgi:predicted permease
MNRARPRLLLTMILLAAGAAAAAAPAPSRDTETSTKPVKQIDIYVTPYYVSAKTLGSHPIVAVATAFDTQLSSNNREDILAVRDAIQAQSKLITPMTLMVLAIRLYDVGLRDDAVFWFYVAKNRYLTMADVLDMKAASLATVDDAMGAFATLAGPFINTYAFCNLAKQRDEEVKSIAWIEQHPYEAIFMEKLPALPGDRTQNLRKSIQSLKETMQKERQYFDDPKNLEDFNKTRKENHVAEQFCWVN